MSKIKGAVIAFTVSFWYWFVMLVINTSWIVPGIVGSVAIAAFYLAFRRKGEFSYRLGIIYFIGVLCTLIVSWCTMATAPMLINLVNAVVMPLLMCALITFAHEYNKK